MPHFGRIDMSPSTASTPTAMTVSGSPYVFTAPSDGLVVLSGGTVSLVQYGRGSTLTALGLVGGLIPVVKDDTVRITWAISAPSLTFIPGRTITA